MRKPLFSVIIPALNEEKFLPKLLISLANQTKKNFEVIVVDGSSKDNTVKVAKAFAKKLPSLTVLVSNTRSPSSQRNVGAQASRGQWLIFVDADSVLLPYSIERMAAFIGEHNPDYFTTWFRPDSEVVADAMLTLVMNLTIEGSKMFKTPLGPGPLTVVRQSALHAVGGYDETHAFSEDLDLSLRLDKAGFQFHVFREALCVWSLRRFRQEGTMHVMQAYAKTGLSGLIARRAPKQMSGYLMAGGDRYGKKRPIQTSALRRYQRKLQQLTKEFFS